MKFKVGDKVRLARESISHKLKESMSIKYSIVLGSAIEDVSADRMYLVNYVWYSEQDLELVPEEPEFEYGEEIEVRDFTDRKWRKGIFVCKIPGPVSYKFLIVNPHQEKEFKEGLEFTTVNWKYARKRKNELKRSAVAKKFGVSEDFILID